MIANAKMSHSEIMSEIYKLALFFFCLIIILSLLFTGIENQQQIRRASRDCTYIRPIECYSETYAEENPDLCIEMDLSKECDQTEYRLV